MSTTHFDDLDDGPIKDPVEGPTKRPTKRPTEGPADGVDDLGEPADRYHPPATPPVLDGLVVDRPPTVVLAAVLTMTVLVVALVQALTVAALPAIAAGLPASPGLPVSSGLPGSPDGAAVSIDPSWLVTGYLLAAAATLPLWWLISGRRRHKGAFLVAGAVFGLASMGAGLDMTAELLVGFRTLQGIGAAGLLLSGFALAVELTPGRGRGRTAGLLGGLFAATSMALPVLAPVRNDLLGGPVSWRGWLLVAGVLVTAAVLVVAVALPSSRPLLRLRPRPVEALLFGALALALLLATWWVGTEYAWDSLATRYGLPLLASGLLLVLLPATHLPSDVEPSDSLDDLFGDNTALADPPTATIVARTSDGTPITDAVLTLLDLTGQQIDRGRVDQDGQLRLPAEPASYVLIARASGFRPHAGIVELGEAHRTEVELTGESGLVGTIRRSAGDPVEGATIALRDRAGNALSSQTTGRDGRYGFDELDPGSYSLMVTAPSYRQAAVVVQVDRADTVRQDVELVGGAHLHGTIRGGPGGPPLAAARVSLIDTAGHVVAVVPADTDGRYRFCDVAEGDYTVVATVQPPAAAHLHLVGGDDTRHDLELLFPAAQS